MLYNIGVIIFVINSNDLEYVFCVFFIRNLFTM